MFYIGIIGVAIGFGGFLSLFPTFTNQQFGKLMYGSNYGVVYQAYGLAALAGVYINSVSGGFTNTFIIAAICAAFGLGLSFMIKEEKAVKTIKVTPQLK
jgi:MFS transporter, OFA family, oxalate/formate antiporter